jgi:DNA-binding transcriptional MerR regulator
MENDQKPDDAATYFKEWYGKNGDKLNKTRKSRYHTDPEYREKVLEQNREARKRRRQEALEEKRKEHGARQLRTTNNWKTVEVQTPDGESAQLYTIGAAAKIIGCSVQALRLWERRRIIPPTEMRYSKGDRLYTLEQIDTIKLILQQQGRLNENRVRPRPLQSVRRRIQLSNSKVREVDLFRIGVLATRVGRTVVTLEQLEQRGVLPATPFRVSDLGYRLYTPEMMDAVKEAFDRRVGEVRGDEEWQKFHDEILEAWKAQGVIGATTLDVKPKKKSKKE